MMFFNIFAITSLWTFCDAARSRPVATIAALQDSEAPRGPAASNCQYAGINGQRPKNQHLVSICLAGPDVPKATTKACQKNAKGYGGRVATLTKNDFSVADCEELCTTNWFCRGSSCGPLPELKGGCRGYVIRDPFKSEANAKPMCWLIPSDAPSSGTYTDEVKFDRLVLHGYGSKTPKKTYVKQQCGCGTRYVHVNRDPLATQLQILQSKLKNGPTGADTRKDKVLALALKSQVRNLTTALRASEQVASLGGVYDWLPLLIPHRLEKGHARFIPHSMLKLFSGTGSLITGQKNQVGYYWDGPIRVTNMYKKLDLSALLYKCLDKRTKVEAWYIVQRDTVMREFRRTLKAKGIDYDDDPMPEISSANIKPLLVLFFNMRCMGHRVGDDGSLFKPYSSEPLGVSVNPAFLSNGPGEWSSANTDGCFPDSAKAEKKQEEMVVAEILNSNLEGMVGVALAGGGDGEASHALLKNDICENLLFGEENNVLTKMDTAEKVLKWQSALTAAWWASSKIANVAELGGRVKRWWYGATTSTTTTVLRETDKYELLGRTKDLTEAMKQVMIRIAAIASTEDPQLKLFCAREMLETVQDAGGIWPKISQNLAMRPDLVKDDYARNKLKETQSGNKDQGKERTLEYIDAVNPQIEIPRFGQVSITEFMEYKKFLSAGSVGQVDVWTLRKDTKRAKQLSEAFQTQVLPRDWHGDRENIIVKTVFDDTEILYLRDWTLLEILFKQFGKYLPKQIGSVWDVLSNLETSLFDEFDLRKEAGFTQRGRTMLADFSRLHSGPGLPKVTTPVGLATSSKYVMLQTMAPGKPLSDYMEQVKGQWDRLAEWRIQIYTTILKVFGFTAIKNGFFQADPHPGNWFWDTDKRVLTLIDWGGVENWQDEPHLQKAHCDLARLYSTMGAMSELWDTCDAVSVAPVVHKNGTATALSLIGGTYKRSGVSIHMAKEGESELLLGHTYAVTYKHATKPYTLWYDGDIWHVSEVDLFDPEVTITKASSAGIAHDQKPDQTFFGLALGQRQKDISSEGVVMQWDAAADGRKYAARVTSAAPRACNEHADRTQAYQMAANQLGITLRNKCQRFMFLDTSDSKLQVELKTDKIALVCVYTNDEGVIKGKVGVPPKDFDIKRKGDSEFLLIPVTADAPPQAAANQSRSRGQRAGPRSAKSSVDSDEQDNDDKVEVMTERPLLSQVDGAPIAFQGASDRLKRRVVNSLAALNDKGVGKAITWEGSGLRAADKPTQALVFDQAQRAYALAASLFDSDVAEAAVMALNGRQSLSLFEPGEVPQVYTLFARCAIVFHGMMMDVLKENSLRLVPVSKLQWLLQPNGDRFFQAWRGFANDYFQTAGTCPEGGWAAISQSSRTSSSYKSQSSRKSSSDQFFDASDTFQ